MLKISLNKNTIYKFRIGIIYPSPYWTCRVYGTGKWLRRYGYYPKFVPLCVYNDHAPGASGLNPILRTELANDAPAIFYHIRNNVNAYRFDYDKPCFKYESLFVFYRRKYSISKKHDARGVLFFLAHGTSQIVDNNSVDLYLSEIKKLRELHGHVSICVHYNEIKNGISDIYKNEGYDVFCAGEPIDPNFIENFYEIMIQHEYVASNFFGSYALYAVEMSIPFFLYGSKPSFYNNGDSNIEKNSDVNVNSNYMIDAEKLFRNYNGVVPNNDQINFCKKYLGDDGSASRLVVSVVLYLSLASFFLSIPQKFIKNIIKLLYK